VPGLFKKKFIGIAVELFYKAGKMRLGYWMLLKKEIKFKMKYRDRYKKMKRFLYVYEDNCEG
jgi:hypothetical protein